MTRRCQQGLELEAPISSPQADAEQQRGERVDDDGIKRIRHQKCAFTAYAGGAPRYR
jgi:hypothetical protein